MIDSWYDKAIKAGALGGKLLGAGGGGFLLLYVPLDYLENVKSALSDLLYVPFEFENSGTQIIHYTPENFSLQE
jgi:D-glycero-alpha-D-manno-heptose-7-phosphate kinase